MQDTPPIFDSYDMMNYFLSGYDLTSGYLEREDCLTAIDEITDHLDEHPGDIKLVLALDSLNSALGDRNAATTLLSGSTGGSDHPICMLRRARHHLAQGEKEIGEDLLRQIIRDEDEDIVQKLCIFLAHGLLDNREESVRSWNTLLEEYDLRDVEYDNNFIVYPDDCTLLGDLPYTENILGIALLRKYDLLPGLEHEAYALILSLEWYLNELVGIITHTGHEEGIIMVFAVLPHAVAICTGARTITGEILDKPGVITSDSLRKAADEALDTLQQSEQKMKVLKILTDVLLLHEEYEEELIQVLRDAAGGNDDCIITMIALFQIDELKEKGSELIEALIRAHPDNLILQKRKFKILLHEGKYQEALDYGESLPEGILHPDDLTELRADILMQEGKEEEATVLLFSLINEDRMSDKIDTIFTHAIRQGRVEDLIRFLPAFEKEGVKDKVYYMKGIERLLNRDAKGGLSLIEKAVRAGFPEAYAMLGVAIIMNKTGFQKRSAGLCERILKKSKVPPKEVYPVLIEAYRLLGKEKEAAIAETKMREE